MFLCKYFEHVGSPKDVLIPHFMCCVCYASRGETTGADAPDVTSRHHPENHVAWPVSRYQIGDPRGVAEVFPLG